MLNANAEGINKSVYSSWCQKRDGGEKGIQVKDTREEDRKTGSSLFPFHFLSFLLLRTGQRCLAGFTDNLCALLSVNDEHQKVLERNTDETDTTSATG